MTSGPERDTTCDLVGGRARGLGASLVVLCAGLCYANSFRVPFLLDDPLPGETLDFRTRPLVWASFALNRAWSGGSTWSYHLVNVLVHVVCATLLLALLDRTLPRAAPGLAPRTRAGFALAAALVWTAHPLQTGAVTYLSQRAESMGAGLVLLCLYAFVRSCEGTRARAWRALCLAALGLGFATKETIVAAPVLILLYDATFLARGWRAALCARAGFHALLGATTLAAFAAVTAPLLFRPELSVGFHLPEFTALAYARTQPGVILHYLRLFLWPHPLVFDHDWPAARALGDWLPQTLALGLLLGLTAALLGRRSWAGFALAASFVLLAPTSSVVPIRDAAFEHRAYLALAGWTAVALAGGLWLCRRLAPRRPWLPVVLTGLAVLALTAATVRRNRDYRSARALWQTVVERAPHNERGFFYLAGGLLEEGRGEEAIAALEQAFRLDPEYPQALNRLANVYLRRGEFARAVPYLERAVALSPDPIYRHGLGNALFGAGEPARAEAEYRRALAAAPGKAEYHQSLANLLARSGRPAEAAGAYRAALQLDPSLASSHLNLAAMLLDLGDPPAALAHLRSALALPPDTAEEHFHLGRCLTALGRTAEAEAALREAQRLGKNPELRARIQVELERILGPGER